MPATGLPTNKISARALLAALAAAGGLASTASAAPAGPASLRVALSAGQVTIGRPLSLTATLQSNGAALAGSEVQLQLQAGRDRGFRTIAHGATGTQGTFTFAALKLERDCRLRVLAPAEGKLASSPVAVIVNPAVQVYSRPIGPGQTYLAIRLRHDRIGPSAPSTVRWYIAKGNSRHFRLVDVTSSRELARGLTYANAIVASPWRHLRWRVCLNPPWEFQMGRRTSTHNCPTEDFSEGGHGR